MWIAASEERKKLCFGQVCKQPSDRPVGLCAQYLTERPTEPMKSQEIPTVAWSRISVELFQLDGKHYLVSVDHDNDYFELDVLKNATASTVIRAMERNFARRGIPQECISDNRPWHNSIVMITPNLAKNMG